MNANKTAIEAQLDEVMRLRKELESINDKLYGENAEENEDQWTALLEEKTIVVNELEDARKYLQQLRKSAITAINGAARNMTQYTDIHNDFATDRRGRKIHGIHGVRL